MKRGKRKAMIMAASGVGNLPIEVQRVEHFARTRGKHCRAYMQLIARKGARVTNAKRAQLRAV